MQYDHKKIEKKWQEEWAKNKIYTTPDQVPGKDNFYLLVEFPYPSGNLHVGHWYSFAVPDILARYTRMTGKNVLYPIGFDAFGLPAENAAIKNKLNPRVWTEQNISYMSNQIRSMGTMFDWSREVRTIDPAYYKWTQWQFLKFLEKGLAYQKDTPVNWCPSCKTVLANEQVIDGRCERCNTEVVQKMMLQWNLKITDYADRLHDDLDQLEWPSAIKDSQRAWIGRSEGAELDIEFTTGDKITIFTTRIDTLFGASSFVLAPEHPWLASALQTGAITNASAVQQYIDDANKKTELERQTGEKDKTGVKIEGVEAMNPANGERLPIFVADYVLGNYGTGAIMTVPAHDERDAAFARKLDAPFKEVVASLSRAAAPRVDAVREGEAFEDRNAVMCVVKHWEKDEYLAIQWKDFDVRTFISGGIEAGETPEEAGKREITEESGYTDARFVRQLGGTSIIEFYHRKKQQNVRATFRYLSFELQSGERIEMSAEEAAKHEVVWKKPEELSAFLTIMEKERLVHAIRGEDELFTGDGVLVNSGEFSGMKSDEARVVMTERFGRAKKTYRLRDWIVSRQRYWGVPIPVVHCDKCGIVAVPEDQLPVLLPDVEDYLPTGDGKSPLAKVTEWVNVACPQCGGEAKRETDTFDTFIDSSWYFVRYTDPKNESAFVSPEKEQAWMPIDLYSGGAEHTTLHLLYSRFWHKAMYDLGLVGDSEPYTRRLNRGIILGPDGQKMSKSKGNVVDPDAVVEKLGADTVRMYLAFIGPYDVAAYPWNPDGVVGVRRFLERVARAEEYVGEEVPGLNVPLHKALKKVGEDCAALKFNTAISQMMIFLNAVEKEKRVGKAQWSTFIKMLAPFAPHLAEELWGNAGNTDSVHLSDWPQYDERYLVEDTVTIAIQINGKTRGDVAVASDASKEATEAAAREAVASRLEGAEIIRTVVVPGRLVNFVLKSE